MNGPHRGTRPGLSEGSAAKPDAACLTGDAEGRVYGLVSGPQRRHPHHCLALHHPQRRHQAQTSLPFIRSLIHHKLFQFLQPLMKMWAALPQRRYADLLCDHWPC